MGNKFSSMRIIGSNIICMSDNKLLLITQI